LLVLLLLLAMLRLLVAMKRRAMMMQVWFGKRNLARRTHGRRANTVAGGAAN
jgi:hypothetical protein